MTIDAIGVTIRIRERSDAPPPKRKTASPFAQHIINAARQTDTLALLHNLIDGKPPKICALVVLAAMEKGILAQPPYSALRAEFPEIGARPNYAYYLSRPDNYRAQIDAIKLNF